MFSRFFNKRNTQPEHEPNNNSESLSNEDPQMANLSADKLKAIIVSLNKAEPAFKRAGYLMEQLDVEFGTTPKLTPYFKQLMTITEEVQETLLAEVSEQQLIKFILISLFKSARMQSLFADSEFYYYGMEIDISGVPCVRTIFKRKEALAEM